jgi:hypothetical protein
VLAIHVDKLDSGCAASRSFPAHATATFTHRTLSAPTFCSYEV